MEGRGYVVPDSILVGARDRNALESSLDAEQMSVSLDRFVSLSVADLCI